MIRLAQFRRDAEAACDPADAERNLREHDRTNSGRFLIGGPLGERCHTEADRVAGRTQGRHIKSIAGLAALSRPTMLRQFFANQGMSACFKVSPASAPR